MSLRHKLLLLLTGLTVSVVVITVGAGYGEVRGAASAAAEERLGRVVEQLTELVSTSSSERLRVKEEVSARPALRTALTGGRVDTAAVLRALEPLRAPADSGLAIEIRDAEGRTVFSDMEGVGAGLDVAPPLEPEPAYGAFLPVGDEVHYWSTAPILSRAGAVLGWTVQERRIGNSQTADPIEDLIGSESRVVFARTGDSLAVTLAGESVPSPLDGIATDRVLEYRRDGVDYVARAATVRDAPWLVLVEIPAAAVNVRPMEYLRTMGLLGLAIVLAAVLVASALGRRLTEPLDELVEATEAMSRGEDPGQVSATRGGDEMDRLARAFNEMSRRVTSSRAQLEARLVEERELARALEESNVQAEKARQEAQEASRAKSEFLATMSHEVRTPINAIMGYCDLLDMEISGTLSEEQRDKVARIRRASRLLSALVEDVLDFSHLDAGAARLEEVDAAASDAVLAAASATEPPARTAGLSVDLQVPADLRYRGDPRRVEQVLMNLLSNAVKFTREGGVTVSAARAGNGRVRIDVQDTGPGIAHEHQERVFEPFVQGEGGFTRRYGGAGLGLSISRELARTMGGDLTLRSIPGEGSCFTLWLPEAPPGRHAAVASD